MPTKESRVPGWGGEKHYRKQGEKVDHESSSKNAGDSENEIILSLGGCLRPRGKEVQQQT